MEWHAQRYCTDIGEYELIVELQKRDWQCEQKSESWKWTVIYNGTVMSSGSVNDVEQAKKLAEENLPETISETSDSDCASCESDHQE